MQGEKLVILKLFTEKLIFFRAENNLQLARRRVVLHFRRYGPLLLPLDGVLSLVPIATLPCLAGYFSCQLPSADPSKISRQAETELS